MIENTIKLPDGRLLGYGEYGRPEGKPIIVLHGTPGARFGALFLRLEPMMNEGLIPAIRVFVLERSGYGLSQPNPGRTVDKVAEDTLFFADALELERFALFGGSGGAPFALACSERSPHRITKTAISAGLGPVYIPELLEGVAKEDLHFLKAAKHEPQVIIDYAEKAHRDPISFFEQLFAEVPEDRRKQIPEAVKNTIIRMISESTKSPYGMLDDYRSFGQPWNVSFEAIRVPVRFWHSEGDSSVPISHAEYLVSRIPNATLKRFLDLDHIATSSAAVPEALAYLAE